MKRYALAIMCAAFLSLPTTQAQTSADILRFSNYNQGYGTARSAAMGGAFTSLGADLSAASLNPAGFGLYRGSEASVTLSLPINTLESTYSVGQKNSVISRSKTSFDLNSAGVALNLFNGSGALTSATAAITYNKLADFNGRANISGISQWSMGDIFVDQLNAFNPPIPPANLDAPEKDIYKAFNTYPTGIWNAIMGYQSYLINYDNNQYTLAGLLSPGAVSMPYMRQFTSGNIAEYGLSGGINLMNKLYFGLSVGIQDLYYKDRTEYTETYRDNQGSLSSFDLNQRLHMTASAVNVKFGMIAVPADGLRIGLAFHTPTYISVHEEYTANMFTHIVNEASGFSDTPLLVNDYDMRTPMRFLSGISYQFGPYGLLSFDYERVWYNKMKMSSDYDHLLETDIDQEVGQLYKAADNFRVGGELVVLPSVFLRAGYAYYGSAFKHAESDQGVTQNISGGIGFRGSAFSVDLTYIYMKSKLPPYRLYDYTSPIDGAQIVSGDVHTTSTRSNITLTLAMRF